MRPKNLLMVQILSQDISPSDGSGESFSRSFKELVRMCLQKEARKRPTVHTLLNSKFFKSNWSVAPIVDDLLCHISNISVPRACVDVVVYLLDPIVSRCLTKQLPPPVNRKLQPTACTLRRVDETSCAQGQTSASLIYLQ